LVLELTERGVPDKISLEGMRFAQRLGLSIAIDDIEGGNLNLLLLARSKVDYIKLDKSLVDTVDEHGFPGPVSQEVAQVVTLGSPLLVAEGIETEVQLTSLKNMGVQLGQGWLISKALGRDEFLVFYENCHNKQN
jgi:sensor c-di-GMP phosphodiesterase-like protein